jgi:hypothetical protein
LVTQTTRALHTLQALLIRGLMSLKSLLVELFYLMTTVLITIQPIALHRASPPLFLVLDMP